MSLVAGADLRLGRHFQCKACRDRLMDYPTLLIPRLRASACAFTKRLRNVAEEFPLSGRCLMPFGSLLPWPSYSHPLRMRLASVAGVTRRSMPIRCHERGMALLTSDNGCFRIH